MFATMLESDYMKKQKFKDNFWVDFKDVLGKGHVIKGLEKCDFRPIHDHLLAEREQKKSLPKEVCFSASKPIACHSAIDKKGFSCKEESFTLRVHVQLIQSHELSILIWWW